MKTGSGFGIAAIIASVIAIFVPLAGMFIAWIALVLAIIAASCGDKRLSIATSFVCAINLLFFTPAMLVGGPFTIIPSAILCLAPIAAILIRASKKGVSK